VREDATKTLLADEDMDARPHDWLGADRERNGVNQLKPTRVAAGARPVDQLQGAWAVQTGMWAVNTAKYGETPVFASTGRSFANTMLIIKKEGDAWMPNPSFFAIVPSAPSSSANEDELKQKDKTLAKSIYNGLKTGTISSQISTADWPVEAEEGVHFFPSLSSKYHVSFRKDTETFGGAEFKPGGYGKGDFLIVQLGYHKKDDTHFLGDGYYWRQGSDFLGVGKGLQILPLPRY